MPPRPGAEVQAANVAKPTWVMPELRASAPELATALDDLAWPETLPMPQPRRPYARRVLYASAQGEIVLVAWTPHAECAVHDHGGGQGRIFVLRGAVQERSWSSEAALRAGRAPRRRTRSIGQSLAVSCRQVHDMRDVAAADAHALTLTLHVYQQVGAAMRVQDPARRRTLLVPSNHGAWLPSSRETVGEEPWPTI